jgi:hypothetical protein
MTDAAFLALWNDLARGREAEYDTWHTREHLPERVAAPGFRNGRRYTAPSHPTHRWFTLYDVEDPGVFETPEYLDLLRNPTSWSASMRPDFRNFLRVRLRSGKRVPCGIAPRAYHARRPRRGG